MSPSIDPSSIPTISSLYNKGELHQAPTHSTLYSASSTLNAKVSLIQTDITKLATTCIVNAANKSLLGGSGVIYRLTEYPASPSASELLTDTTQFLQDGAIHAAAGHALYDDCLLLNGCPTGSAKITSAHALPSKHIIHAVGPIYAEAKRTGGESRPKELLEGCYRTSLDLAAGLKNLQGEDQTSIAFSCLSTGVYGYPSNEAAEVASRSVRDWLDEQEHVAGQGKVGRVVFCCFLEKDVQAYKEWLPRVFPPTDTELLSTNTLDEKLQEPNNKDADRVVEEGDRDGENASTIGNNQHLASATLASEPATKKQKQASNTTAPPSQHLPLADADDKEDWEAVERPEPSLASSTVDSTTTTSESAPLGESTVNVDADAAEAAAREEIESKDASSTAAGFGVGGGGSGGGLEDEGVEVEKPGGLEEDDGVKVEIPKVALNMGRPDNMLGKDW